MQNRWDALAIFALDINHMSHGVANKLFLCGKMKSYEIFKIQSYSWPYSRVFFL